MVPGQTEAVRGRQRGHVSIVVVVPFLPWPRQRGLEGVFVSKPGQSSVFTNLLVVDGVDGHAVQPYWCVPPGHLPGELPESVSVFLGHLRSDLQGALDLLRVWREQDSAVRLDRQDAIAGL